MTKMETSKDYPPDLQGVHSHPSNVSRTTRKDDIEGIDGNNKHLSFSVQGLYTRYYPTPEEKETKEKQFICCRRRMLTKPFVETEVNGDSIAKEEGKEQKQKDKDEKKYESAMFVPENGLVGPQFWHEYDIEAKVVREDRAILFQAQENYEKLISTKLFKPCFDDIDYMENPTFGEQVIVKGINTSDLAIGDVFEIAGGHSPLVVEITAPRKPCNYMNMKNGTVSGRNGIQYYSHHHNLAGWFARVLIAGELREGMKFTRKKHPNPKWTLDYVHKALYGEGTHLESLMYASSWNRDREELEEVLALPQLGEYEWKTEGRKQLLKFDGVDWKTVGIDHIDPQAKSVPDNESRCVTH